MKQLALAVSFVFLSLPFAAHAAVVINEVAWMGSASNANAEWIELSNSGDASVDLSGWTLTSSTGSPSISLTGSVAGNGYYLLERTSATNIPGLTADQVYTGALSNSGATLTLADSTGDVEDVVEGGSDWCAIGGDNSTKETAQRSGDDWITASATPDAANAATGDAPPGCATTRLRPRTQAQLLPRAQECPRANRHQRCMSTRGLIVPSLPERMSNFQQA